VSRHRTAARHVSGLDAFLWAIGQQESGGNYNARNATSGAVGKYQVMPANVPSWTKAALGRSLTPEQFRASPAAQEKVARHVLGDYYEKWGPKGAAAAWYAGPANHDLYKSGSSQPGGPSIAGYVNSVVSKMNSALNGKARVSPVRSQAGGRAAAGDGTATATDASFLDGVKGLAEATVPFRLLGHFNIGSSITGEISKLLVSTAGLMTAGALVVLGLYEMAKPTIDKAADSAGKVAGDVGKAAMVAA
jgi:hypothetical protein